MARLARLALGGHVHLVELDALPGRRLVHDDEDRHAILAALLAAAHQNRVAVHAYAVLDERLYLLATPQYAEGLGQLVQGLGRRYVPRFNRRHNLAGRLWDGRYRATIVQPGSGVLEAMVFVCLAPAAAGGEDEAQDPPWCSARHHLGQERDPMLTDRAEYWQLGNTPFERERAFRRRLEEGLPMARRAQLAESVHKGWVVGDATFLAHLAEQTDRPLQPRRRGRPRKSVVG